MDTYEIHIFICIGHIYIGLFPYKIGLFSYQVGFFWKNRPLFIQNRPLFISSRLLFIWKVIWKVAYFILVVCLCAAQNSALSTKSRGTGWRRLIGSPKLQIIFHKRATKYRALLLKMTYKDKGSYESSPPCMDINDEDSEEIYTIMGWLWIVGSIKL